MKLPCLVCGEAIIPPKADRATCGARVCQKAHQKAHQKAYWKAYNQRPEVKAHRKAYKKAYCQRRKLAKLAEVTE